MKTTPKSILLVALICLVLVTFTRQEETKHEAETNAMLDLLATIKENLKSQLGTHQQHLQYNKEQEAARLTTVEEELDDVKEIENKYKQQYERAQANTSAIEHKLQDTQSHVNDRIAAFEADYSRAFGYLRKELLLVERVRALILKLRGHSGDIRSCKDILEKHPEFASKSGMYHIWSDIGEIEVYCDMETDGGGWTRLDHNLIGKNNELMKFEMLSGPSGGNRHMQWHDASQGQFSIGDDRTCASSVNQWAATILAPHPFSEVFGEMQVHGWGSDRPDDGSRGAYTDSNFFKPLGSRNYSAYVVGAHNGSQGKILKDGGVWGNNFTGAKSFSFSKQNLGFSADKILHTTTDCFVEVVRWQTYAYFVR